MDSLYALKKKTIESLLKQNEVPDVDWNNMVWAATSKVEEL